MCVFLFLTCFFDCVFCVCFCVFFLFVCVCVFVCCYVFVCVFLCVCFFWGEERRLGRLWFFFLRIFFEFFCFQFFFF